MANISQLSALQELLKPPDNEPEDISSCELKPNTQTPGHIGTAKKISQGRDKDEKHSNNIWGEEEIPEGELPSDDLGGRIVPVYEMLFKQRVTSEDIFLGMGNKNPSTACCEDLIVKIDLPETEYADVNLNVTDTFLDCQTPKYKLGVHFPKHVESKNGKAQWYSEKCLLTVSVPLWREYDFLNMDSR
ncbi:protein PIH1D3-like [Dendronephthya gigantea]|uniref:protein PIH1D3-like n=1 Tax=Dendronephthya gigantea TaxID=151771 RepID=UPI00106B9281|nr:protein PIH1D3-like [Dendronephthya gigantea]